MFDNSAAKKIWEEKKYTYNDMKALKEQAYNDVKLLQKDITIIEEKWESIVDSGLEKDFIALCESGDYKSKIKTKVSFKINDLIGAQALVNLYKKYEAAGYIIRVEHDNKIEDSFYQWIYEMEMNLAKIFPNLSSKNYEKTIAQCEQWKKRLVYEDGTTPFTKKIILKFYSPYNVKEMIGESNENKTPNNTKFNPYFYIKWL